MALSQVYTAVTLDTITAARWNAEFGNIYNNGTDVAFPLTKNVSFGSFSATSIGGLTMSSGGLMTMTAGRSLWAKGADIASATTTDLSAATGNYVHITGTTTITGLSTVQAGTLMFLEFDGALTFTHNATSLILPGGANITTAAGDVAVMVSEGSGNWRCVNYLKASGYPITSTLTLLATASASTSATIDFTSGLSSTYDQYVIKITDLLPATDNADLWMRLSKSGSFQSGGTDYRHARMQVTDAGTTSGAGSTGDTKVLIAAGLGTSTGETFSTTIMFSAPSGTVRYKMFGWSADYYTATPAIARVSGSGAYVGGAEAIDGVRFMMSAGNITSGNFALYGVRKS